MTTSDETSLERAIHLAREMKATGQKVGAFWKRRRGNESPGLVVVKGLDLSIDALLPGGRVRTAHGLLIREGERKSSESRCASDNVSREGRCRHGIREESLILLSTRASVRKRSILQIHLLRGREGFLGLDLGRGR